MAKYDPAEATRSILLDQGTEPDAGPPPPPRLAALPHAGLAVAQTPAPATPALEGPRKWGSPKGRVWQIHVTLTHDASDLLDQHRRPDEAVASVVIRVLREASERLATEGAEGASEEDFFADPAPPGRRYRVPNGVRKHFDLTARQREGLAQYMDSIGATNLSYVVTRAIELVLGQSEKHKALPPKVTSVGQRRGEPAVEK